MLTKSLQARRFANAYFKVLREEALSHNVKECQYAVRGAIPLKGAAISARIKQGDISFPFQKVVPMNIGNPQAVGQGFISFNREVLSGLINPEIVKSDIISDDAKFRIEQMNQLFSSPVGAYTSNSKGHSQVRQAVANYINKRDGHEVDCDWNNIYLTNGASEAVRLAFRMLIRDKQDGVLVPIPQYPLYSALLTLDGGTMIRYYLQEDKNWGIDGDDIVSQIKHAKDLGINVRSIVVINPGNPSGSVLRREDIEDIIRICHEHEILIMADEVYQNNIYGEVPFNSFRKVLAEMGAPYRDEVELLSMHSVSKGLQGECGFRGGYLEAHNLDKYADEMLYKLKSIELCSNTIGQIATSLMVNPPTEGRESSACVGKYLGERNAIENGLKERALILTKTFENMENVTSNEIEGSMYGFPRVEMSEKAVARAKEMGVAPDFMYCLDMLNETGIMTVPGSGFGQVDGTHHFRITNLVCPTEEMKDVLHHLEAFNTRFHERYQ